jgi:hypothetical protein
MAKKKKSKNKKRNKVGEIFDSIRKPVAPKGSKFKTRKGELTRKKKHKGKIEDAS